MANIFNDFYNALNDLVNGLDFGIVINKMFEALPDQIINVFGICFVLTFLGWVIHFIKGWF